MLLIRLDVFELGPTARTGAEYLVARADSRQAVRDIAVVRTAAMGLSTSKGMLYGD